MKVIVSAGGRFHAIHLAHQLQRHNLLKKLFSFSYADSDKNYVSQSLVHTVNLCKCMDLIFSNLRLANFVNRSVFNSYKDDIFDSAVSESIKNMEDFNLFVGWANNSLKTLSLVKKLGVKTIIESGSCHIIEQNRLIGREYDKWGINFVPTCHRVTQKMCAEYEMADYIMTLSDFSRQSFITQGIPECKVLKAPCGIDFDFFSQNGVISRKNKFRVIFVGLVCLRKGIQYLIEAWNKLNLPSEQAELIIVGNQQKDFSSILKKLSLKKNIIFLGSVNREKLLNLYNRSSVFVLPSIEDGFGMVLGEAMASGVPVICTTNVGASELVKDYLHGFVIPAANSDVLAEKILWCYNNQNELLGMGLQSRKMVGNRGWSNYGNQIIETYHQILKV